MYLFTFNQNPIHIRFHLPFWPYSTSYLIYNEQNHNCVGYLSRSNVASSSTLFFLICKQSGEVFQESGKSRASGCGGAE